MPAAPVSPASSIQAEAAVAPAFVKVTDLVKDFGQRGAAESVHALANISLSVYRGQMVSLLGASGSGKTTLLRCIAGLETPGAGEIEIGGELVYSESRRVNMPIHKRRIGMIFQSYALWPHLTVAENVKYPLARRKFEKQQTTDRVRHYLDLVGCGRLAARYPHELSGGQQQRVALARALVYEPAVVLFDEPLSNLDAALREQLRYHIKELQRSIGFTGIFVTHDQAEAFFLGDQIAILSDGHLLQMGSAADIHRQPNSPAVAAFIGAANVLEGDLQGGAGDYTFFAKELGSLKLNLVGVLPTGPGRVRVMIRPEDVALAGAGPGPSVRVVSRVDLGRTFEYVLELPAGTRWRARIPAGAQELTDDRAIMHISAAHAFLI